MKLTENLRIFSFINLFFYKTFHWFYILDTSRKVSLNIHNDWSFMHCNKGSCILSLGEKQQMEWENTTVKVDTGFSTPY